MSYIEKKIESSNSPDEIFYFVSEIINGCEEASLSKGEKLVLRIDNFLAQINNGGFDQYFFNSGVWNAHECLGFLKQVGAIKMAQLLSRAIQIAELPQTVPDDYDYEATEEQEEQLNDLDGEFYSIEDEPYAQVLKYMKKNLGEFANKV